jgi:2,3-bisphosphoglycerate-independent phosphoglycerate mutase
MSSDLILRPHPTWPGPRGPLVLAILDGVGLGAGDAADAVKLARTPTLDRLLGPGQFVALRAHGTAVGLPSDEDMGNSEVGHNALGAGVVHDQGAKLVGRALASGTLWEGATWRAIIERCVRHGTALHFLGLLSDGNVHSHQDHLEAMLRRAAGSGVRKLYVHVLLDGRDVAPTSALTYVDRLESVLGQLRAGGVDARIASGGGRMVTTMDRYEADWRMVERGYRARARRGRRLPQRRRGGRDLARRAARHHRSGSAAVRDRGRPRARGPIVDGAGGAVQLPRRPRDRDHPRVRRAHASPRSRAAPPRRALRRHDAVRRRPAPAAALPGGPPAIDAPWRVPGAQPA